MQAEVRGYLKRLRRGDAIHKGNTEVGPIWWFEVPFETVPQDLSPEVFKRLQKTHDLVPAGDGLFGLETSQVWIAKRR